MNEKEKIKIRKATVNDIENGLLDIYIEGYRFHQKGRPDIFDNFSKDVLKAELILNLENVNILVILLNDSIVGYIIYRITNKTTKKLFIEQIVITNKYRRKGLGKKLIEEVKKIGTHNNCDRIELNCWTFNKNALEIYEHIGFNKQRIIYELKI